MDQEIAKRVDAAMREMIANLIVANTELKIRVDLLTAAVEEQHKTDTGKNKSPLRSVQD